jgi:hypothetical protein
MAPGNRIPVTMALWRAQTISAGSTDWSAAERMTWSMVERVEIERMGVRRRISMIKLIAEVI